MSKYVNEIVKVVKSALSFHIQLLQNPSGFNPRAGFIMDTRFDSKFPKYIQENLPYDNDFKDKLTKACRSFFATKTEQGKLFVETNETFYDSLHISVNYFITSENYHYFFSNMLPKTELKEKISWLECEIDKVEFGSRKWHCIKGKIEVLGELL